MAADLEPCQCRDRLNFLMHHLICVNTRYIQSHPKANITIECRLGGDRPLYRQGTNMDQSITSRKRFRFSLRVAATLFLLAGPLILGLWNLRLNYIESRQLSVFRTKLDAKLSSHPSLARSIKRTSGPIPDGVIILLRKDDAYGAVIPVSQTRGLEQIKYKWYYRTDGKSHLGENIPSVRSGTGSAMWKSGQPLARIEFGPFSLVWSGQSNGWGFLYFNDDVPQGICVTGRTSFEGLDPSDEKWTYRTEPDKDASAAR